MANQVYYGKVSQIYFLPTERPADSSKHQFKEICHDVSLSEFEISFQNFCFGWVFSEARTARNYNGNQSKEPEYLTSEFFLNFQSQHGNFIHSATFRD
jgi:hypothetical protein